MTETELKAKNDELLLRREELAKEKPTEKSSLSFKKRLDVMFKEIGEKSEDKKAFSDYENAQKKREMQMQLDRYRASNIDDEYFYKTFDDYKPMTKKQGEYLQATKDIIDGNLKKLIVLGKNGVGKTMLASIAVKQMGGMIVTMFELSLKLRSCQNEEAFSKKLINAPLLVIDEIGRSKGSEFETNLLSYILDKRHSRGKPFIILSNTHFEARCPKGGCEKCFERFFDKDLLSRFRQDSRIIEIEKDAVDYRDSRIKKG